MLDSWLFDLNEGRITRRIMMDSWLFDLNEGRITRAINGGIAGASIGGVGLGAAGAWDGTIKSANSFSGQIVGGLNGKDAQIVYGWNHGGKQALIHKGVLGAIIGGSIGALFGFLSPEEKKEVKQMSDDRKAAKKAGRSTKTLDKEIASKARVITRRIKKSKEKK